MYNLAGWLPHFGVAWGPLCAGVAYDGPAQGERLQLMDIRYHMISAGITTGSDRPTNIRKVMKNVPMSLIQSLNNSNKSIFQNLCFFIPATIPAPAASVKSRRGSNVRHPHCELAYI